MPKPIYLTFEEKDYKVELGVEIVGFQSTNSAYNIRSSQIIEVFS